MSLGVGARLWHYAVTAKLGEEGMGEVYRARDTKLDRDVAPRARNIRLRGTFGSRYKEQKNLGGANG